MALFQLDLKQLPVVETRRSVAGGQIGAAGGAEPVAVGVALVAEHEAEGARPPRWCGAGRCRRSPPRGAGRWDAALDGARAGCRRSSDEHIGDVAGILPPLQVPEGQGAVQQGQHRLIVGQAFDGIGQAFHLPHHAQRAEQRAGDQRLTPRVPSGDRRYRSTSSTARAGSLNS